MSTDLVKQDREGWIVPVRTVEEDPVAVVERATRQANALMDVVEKKKQYAEIEGKKYLYVEAWEIIGAFNGVHAETEWVDPIKEGEQIIGYTASVNLIKNGQVVGRGVMPCGFEDFPCRGKEGMAKHKACQSAAQTWAESKAYRMNFSYVAVLGGYQPTPAEEMVSDGIGTIASSKYLCPIHNVEWFKTKNMKRYAHPPTKDMEKAGETKWCDMERVVKEQEKQADDTLARTKQVLDDALADAQEGPQEAREGPSAPTPVSQQVEVPQQSIHENLGQVFTEARQRWGMMPAGVATLVGHRTSDALVKAVGEGIITPEQVWQKIKTEKV